jgi:riboflavin synthase
MFSGIIESIGTVTSISNSKKGGIQLEIDPGKIGRHLNLGDSIAVDGACLTVAGKVGRRIRLDISEETKQLTTVANYRKNTLVNLELPLKTGAMISGHFVQGHVDGVAKVTARKCKENQDVRLHIKLPSSLARYCIPKGSIAVNGVSLTIAKLKGTEVEVALIPYTLSHTNLAALRPGESVNVETDVLGRYVVSALEKSYHKSRKGK